MRDIPFDNLPGFSKLFLAYLRASPEALRFYPRAPNLEVLQALARGCRQAPRAEMTKILRRQNEHFGSGAAAMAAIDRLQQPGSVAVVTGQQLGLFGGPLYTVYKALTAVRLSELLASRGIPAAPVFWMEGEDHDLAEAVGADLSASWGVAEGTPVRSVPLPAGIGQILRALADATPDSTHKGATFELLASAYAPQTTMVEAFGRFAAKIFSPFGIILFDPGDVEAKPLAAPVMRRALSDAGALRELIAGRNGELAAAGFHTQVTQAENFTLLFYRPEGPRRAVVTSERGFALKGDSGEATEAELLRRLADAPELFSPNVLLRPLVQDTLFPTAAYVAGPAEIAYFAQAAPLYRHLGVPMPLIWPRSSLTLLNPEVARQLDDAGLTFEDCLAGEQGLFERLLRLSGGGRISDDLVSYASELERALEGLRPGLTTAEASLGAALDTARRKMLHNLDSLRARFLQVEAARNEQLAAQARTLSETLRPKGNYQERESTLPPFLARHGDALMDKLHAAADPHVFAHRIVTLS